VKKIEISRFTGLNDSYFQQ